MLLHRLLNSLLCAWVVQAMGIDWQDSLEIEKCLCGYSSKALDSSGTSASTSSLLNFPRADSFRWPIALDDRLFQ